MNAPAQPTLKVHPRRRETWFRASRMVKFAIGLTRLARLQRVYRYCKSCVRNGDTTVAKRGGRWLVSSHHVVEGMNVMDLLRARPDTSNPRQLALLRVHKAQRPSRSALVGFRRAVGRSGWERVVEEAGGETVMVAVVHALSQKKLAACQQRLAAVLAFEAYTEWRRLGGKHHSAEHFSRTQPGQRLAVSPDTLFRWAAIVRGGGLLALLRDGRGDATGGRRERASDFTRPWLVAAYRDVRSRVETDYAAWRLVNAMAALAGCYCPSSTVLARLAAPDRKSSLPTAPCYPPRDDDQYLHSLKDAKWTEPAEACA